MVTRIASVLAAAAISGLAIAELWDEPRRGSWVREGMPKAGDVNLLWTQIVVRPNLGRNVLQAAKFLQGDLQKLIGTKPPLGRHFQDFSSTRILVEVSPDGRRPESYRVRTDRQGLVITGADDRGAAFGIYELAERLGVDPLYIWTGITPKKTKLIVKKTDFFQHSPDVRWRGLFHDDEDIMPRPFRQDGAPDPNGTVPRIWYERLFETALRLRMNMVAPWVRTNRNLEIQKLASDWGLAYTSHHYDILLSDPYHFGKGLAAKRGVDPKWDWLTNREGIIRYWRAGVEENRLIDAIYPIGLRGTNDYSYRFPADWSQDRKIEAYNEALQIQSDLVHRIVPSCAPKLMHFTMYTEMLPFYQTGKLRVPAGTIIVWPDDNDGRMRGLPASSHSVQHGVYYHLAYLGGSLTKQVHQVVPPSLIENEYRKIFGAKATAYHLVNVSELREYVLGTRLIGDLMWDGKRLLASPDADRRFLRYWCREYFGNEAAVATVDAYFASLKHPLDTRAGAMKVLGAVPSLIKKFSDQPFEPAAKDTLPMLNQRQVQSLKLLRMIQGAKSGIRDPEKARFFFENIELPAAIDRLNCAAAIKLVQAMSEPDRKRAELLCRSAKSDLDILDGLLRRAERPPFERWYGHTWINERTNVLVKPRNEVIRLLGTIHG